LILQLLQVSKGMTAAGTSQVFSFDLQISAMMQESQRGFRAVQI
jgi:hypothetical protein